MVTVTGRAGGKVILVGEHFVVHGGQALALPVRSRSLEVSLEDGTGQLDASGLTWPIDDAFLRQGLNTMLRDLEKVIPIMGEKLDIRMQGDLPLAAGLGGSAALAAALVRAIGVAASEEEGLVHRLEHLAHGNPSGIDGAVICREAPLGIRRGKIRHLHVDESWEPHWWVGLVPREGTTRQAIQQVLRFKDEESARFEKFGRRTRDGASRLAESLERFADEDALRQAGQIFRDAQERLAAMGLCTPGAAKLVEAAEAAGAYGAKISGAGLGGAVIAVAPAGLELEGPWRKAGAKDVFKLS